VPGAVIEVGEKEAEQEESHFFQPQQVPPH